MTSAPAATAQTITGFLLPASTPNSSPIKMAAGPDGALWFTEGFPDKNSREKIGRINLVPTAPIPQAAQGCSSIAPIF